MPGKRKPRPPKRSVVTTRAIAEMGIDDLKATLQYHEEHDQKAAVMLAMMADSSHKGKRLETLMQRAGYTRRELVVAFQEYKSDVMRVKLAKGMPRMADDLLKDSETRTRTCQTCRGAGVVIAAPGADPLTGNVEERCIACDGSGTYSVAGNDKARDKALEIMGLVKRGSAPNFNVNLGAAGNVDSFDSLISKANDMFSGNTVNATAERFDGDE